MSQPTIQKFNIANPPVDGNDRSYLTSDVDSGDTSIAVMSSSGFSGTNFYVLIGDYGEEKAEIKLVSSFTGNTFTIAALSNSHTSSTPVTFIEYNQIKVYGRATSGGSNNLVTTLDIDTTNQHTDYIYDGDSYSYFVTSYYNSQDTEESAFSEEITSTTFGQTSAKKVIESAVRKAMTSIDETPNSLLTWDIAIDILNDGIDEIFIRKRKWSFLHSISSGTNTTTNQAYISKPSDAAILEHLIVDNYKLEWMSHYKYDDYTKAGTTVSTGSPTHFTMKNNKYYLYPTPSAAKAIIYEYYKYPTRIDALTDSLDREFVAILIYYCASQISYIRGNDKRGDKMYAMFQKTLEQQVEEFSGPQQLGDAESIERTNHNYQEQELGDF